MMIGTMRTISAVVLAIASVCMIPSASGETATEKSVTKDQQRFERAVQGLNLSEDQKYQLRTLSETHRTSTQGLRDQIRAAQQVIATTPRSDPNYQATTGQARESLRDARSQLQAQQQQFQGNARALLTTDQLNALEIRRLENRQRMSERRTERMERRIERREQRPNRGDRRPGG